MGRRGGEMVIKGDHAPGLAESISTLRVVEIDPHIDSRWEAFVTSQPNALIYHHPVWLQVIAEVYSYKLVNLACEDAEGRLRGILPLCYNRGLFIGRRFSCLPRTP